MTDPVHHVPEAMLAGYAAGALPYPYAVLVAAHVSLCDDCRAGLETHHSVGGLLFEGMAAVEVSEPARRATLAHLDRRALTEPGHAAGFEIYPGPIASLLGHRPPHWRSLGFGAKQAILWAGAAGSLRLLSIPAGQAVPDHSHGGLELTLVLDGAFSDEVGLFRAGDLEIADDRLEHTPRATAERACICAAATDAPLRFRARIPRLLQPIFRI